MRRLGFIYWKSCGIIAAASFQKSGREGIEIGNSLVSLPGFDCSILKVALKWRREMDRWMMEYIQTYLILFNCNHIYKTYKYW